MATQTAQRALVTAWIDPDDREQLVALARLQDRSLSAELRRAVSAHIERHAADDRQTDDPEAAT